MFGNDIASAVLRWLSGHFVSVAVLTGIFSFVVTEVVLQLLARRGRSRKSMMDRRLDVDAYVVVPFQKISVAGTEIGSVTATPPPNVRLLYLVVPKLVAPDFSLVSVRVGQNSQFASSGEVPADAFSGDLELWGAPPERKVRSVVMDFPIALDLEDPDGREVVITVRNLHPCARNFTAVMFGRRI
jgi:hypothetical protein